jgi:hypothetical protein
MILNNPIFSTWYTDTADIYRTAPVKEGNLTRQERRKVNASPVPCRVYHPEKSPPAMEKPAARERSAEKMACDLSVDIRAGDELFIVRGGNLGHANKPERYFAGSPVQYYDPVAGALTGLQHKEVGLLMDNVIGG